MTTYNTVAQTNNFIILDKYIKGWEAQDSYQTESNLEQEFIDDLKT